MILQGQDSRSIEEPDPYKKFAAEMIEQALNDLLLPTFHRTTRPRRGKKRRKRTVVELRRLRQQIAEARSQRTDAQSWFKLRADGICGYGWCLAVSGKNPHKIDNQIALRLSLETVENFNKVCKRFKQTEVVPRRLTYLSKSVRERKEHAA